MFYYQHHVGDYRRDTGHLTLLEHGIYRQLLDLYYISEKPIDATAIRLICVRTTDECEAYNRVLADFFVERDGVYFHRRCDFEIQRFKEKSDKAKQSIKTRWNKNKELMPDTNVLPTNNEGNTNQLTNKPINQSTNNKEKKQKKVSVSMPEGMNEGIWKDFLSTRVKAITQTGINGIAKQASLAGISLEAALQECCTRGWQSFKADWIKPQGATNGKFNVHAAGRETLARSLVAASMVRCDPWEIQDVVHVEVHQLLPGSTDD